MFWASNAMLMTCMAHLVPGFSICLWPSWRGRVLCPSLVPLQSLEGARFRHFTHIYTSSQGTDSHLHHHMRSTITAEHGVQEHLRKITTLISSKKHNTQAKLLFCSHLSTSANASLGLSKGTRCPAPSTVVKAKVVSLPLAVFVLTSLNQPTSSPSFVHMRFGCATKAGCPFQGMVLAHCRLPAVLQTRSRFPW